MLGPIDAELKLVIAGNHDLDLDTGYWRTSLQEHDNPEEVRNTHLEEHAMKIDIMTGRLAAEVGVTYLDEATYIFTLKSGARFTVYASSYTPESNSWTFGYKHTHHRFNLPRQVAAGITSIAQNPVPDFHIMMTHGPPKGILDK